tara:strand:+ start:5839 stop:8082 length:2244 start_codon:yes stop_codon:yes gene_type:complete
MADKVPIRYAYDGSSLTGIAEYATSDTVGIAFGGTGATSLTDNGILIGNATSAIQVTSALTTNGQIVIGGTSGPAVANITGTSNEVDVTNGDGTIAIGLPAVVNVATCVITPKVCITSQYVLPAADGSAGQIMCTDGSGTTQFAAAASSGHTIAEEGSALASRTCLNFIGSAVTAADNSGTNATDVTVCATSSLLGVRMAAGTACCITLSSAAVGESLVSDTTPQLGGNLDVNGNSIVSASNGNIPITPNGSGIVIIDGLCHPIADGSAGQLLCTDGSAALKFATATAGVTLAGSTNNTIATVTGANALAGEANLTFDGSTLAVSADQYIANGKGLVVGNATAVGGSHGYEIQALGTGGLDAGVTMGNWAASAAGPVMSFIKSRNATIGSNTIVQDDDVLGSIYFTADDGTDFESRAAEIRANIDGTPGANDTPGRLTFHTASDGANTVTERMRIDSAGNMILGGTTTTTSWGASGKIFIEGAVPGIGLRDTTASKDDWMIVNSNGYLTFSNDTNSTEDFVIRGTDPAGVYVQISKAGGHTFNVHNANASNPSGMQMYFGGVSSGDTTDYFGIFGDTGATRAIHYSNGNWVNANNSYGSTSDVKLKQDIVDAPGYWDDFKALQYRKYRLKEEVAQDANAGTKIGLVAQEIEGAFSKLVENSPDRAMQDVPVLDEDGNATYKLDDNNEPQLDGDGNRIPATKEDFVDLGTTTKSIKYSVLHGPVMATVVQELQTRLEAAEAEIAILKG